MHHLSAKNLEGDQKRRWADARKTVYRKVLRDPGASDAIKDEARVKLGTVQGR
jgi:hypothetical protein